MMKKADKDYCKRITANTILKLKDDAKFWWNTKPLPGETDLRKSIKLTKTGKIIGLLEI